MPSTDGLLRSAFGAIVAHPRRVLAVFVVLTAVLATQIPRYRIDASADTLLTRHEEHYVRTLEISRRFAPREFVLVAYRPHDGAVFSRRSLDDIAALQAALGRLPRVETVRSILNVPLLRPGEAVSGEVGRTTLAHRRQSPKELAALFRGHPVYEDLLINRAQTAVAIQVLFRPDRELEAIEDRVAALEGEGLRQGFTRAGRSELDDLERRAEPIRQALDARRRDEIRAMRSMLAPYAARADVYLGGIHVLGYQLVQIIEHDLALFGALITAMVAVVLFGLFGRLRWVLIPLACCACSVVSTIGLLGLLGLKTTVVSSSFVALQLILTLAIVMHLIVQYREYAAAHPDWPQFRLVVETARRKAGPCFYAGLTNVVGFASLAFSELKPVIDFGWMMTIALFFSIGVSLVLVPALMALTRRERAPAGAPPLRPLLLGAARLARTHPVAVVAASAAALAAAGAGVVRLDVENSFIEYFRDDTQVHRELAFIDAEMGGSTPLDLVYTVPEAQRREDLVLGAEAARTLQDIQRALERQPAVGKVLSVVNLTTLARQLNQGKPLTEYELTALYWSMDETLRSDLTGSFFAPATSQFRFSARIRDTTPGLDRAQLLADIRADLAELGIPPERYTLSNLFVLYQDILQQLYASQILTLGIAFVVLTLVMLAIFRSVPLALIGIAPNVLSTAIVLGLMGWLGIALDLMTIMIAAVALGITVDDTIHYIHRYREERAEGDAGAAERTHASVGHALVYTALVVILGLVLLAFSDFVPSILFGLLTGLAMALAVLFDLTLLPVLLRRFAAPMQLRRQRALKEEA